MEKTNQVRLFLSCVSDEFHKSSAEEDQDFVSYRDSLARSLRQAGVQVMAQEDFARGFGDLLQTIDDEVARSTLVVHLVGDMAGIVPRDMGRMTVRPVKKDWWNAQPSF